MTRYSYRTAKRATRSSYCSTDSSSIGIYSTRSISPSSSTRRTRDTTRRSTSSKLKNVKPAMSYPLLIDRYSSELMQFLRLACVTPQMGRLDEYVPEEGVTVERARRLAGAA